MTVRAQSGHEGDKQSVAGQAVHRSSNFQEGTGRRVPKERQVVKRGALPSIPESFEWSEERTAVQASSNQDGKKGSQEIARRAPTGQQDVERPGHSAVRRTK